MYRRPAGLAPSESWCGHASWSKDSRSLAHRVPCPFSSPLLKQLYILPFAVLSFVCDTSYPLSPFFLFYSGKITSLSLISVTHMNTVLASLRTLPFIFVPSRESKLTRNIIRHAMRSSNPSTMIYKENGKGVLSIQKPKPPPPPPKT